ncbi:MAG: di-heme oxidoredictase family protein [Myxococcota bacterium]
MAGSEKKKRVLRVASFIAVAAAIAVTGFTIGSSEGVADPGPILRGDRHQAGDPLPGLSPELNELFDEGRALFEHEFTPSEGLGPIYNERACQTCHGGLGTTPGGPDPNGLDSEFNVTHFAKDVEGLFFQQWDRGGPLLEKRTIQDLVPDCAMPPDTIPEDSNVLSIRHTPAVWGFGLIDAIPDSEILERQDLGVDGIRGTPNYGRELRAVAKEPHMLSPNVEIRGPVRVGRFGWKAQTPTLLQFSMEPLNTELGVSGPFFPQEQTAEGPRFADELPPECDVADHPVNDPDGSIGTSIYHFQALVAPPPRKPLRGGALVGRYLFNRIGCDNCHTPKMRTGPEYWLRLDAETSVRVPQLENRDVHLYSDLLTHDMGDALADDQGATVGRVMGNADGRRWRTTPLWGLRFKEAYLHDGRTDDLREAVLLHGGEADIVRERFERLPRKVQDMMLEFLMSI